jgi:hypothetical protein
MSDRRMPFKLPQDWYVNTIKRLVDTELPPLLGPVTASNAWKYVIAAVMWADRIDGKPYLHLNDRLSTKAGRALAERGRAYLDHHLVPGTDTLDVVDRIARAYSAERQSQGFSATKWQRNNVTGRSFEGVLQELIERLCGVRPAREPQLRTLRGFELAPTGYHSQPDLALFTARDFRLLISTKWTLRKERIGTYLHEAYFYRQRRSDLQVAFVVSEFNLNIIEWLVNDALVDRVYHVHLPMLLDVHDPFKGISALAPSSLVAPSAERKKYERWLALDTKLFDLSQLFEDIERLKPDATAPLDPSDDADLEADADADEDAGL